MVEIPRVPSPKANSVQGADDRDGAGTSQVPVPGPWSARGPSRRTWPHWFPWAAFTGRNPQPLYTARALSWTKMYE